MPVFTIFNSATGEVITKGLADDPSALLASGQEVVNELAPDNTYRDGSGWTAIPARPSLQHTFNWTTHTWVLGGSGGITLADYKGVKQDAIAATRQQKLYSVNVQHLGTAGDGSQDVLVASSLLERERISNAAFEAFICEHRSTSFASRNFFDQFTGLHVTLDGPECIKLQQTMDAYTEAVWATYYTARQAIDVAADYAAAAAAVTSAVWPDPDAGSWP